MESTKNILKKIWNWNPEHAMIVMRIIFPERCNGYYATSREKVFNFINSNITDDDYYDFDRIMSLDFLKLLNEVNLMVKDKACPRNLRNKFYSKKQTFIKELLKNGMISKVIDQDVNYLLFIKGTSYAFHQPKDHLKYTKIDENIIEVGEPYVKLNKNLPFDINAYNDFTLFTILNGNIIKIAKKN